MKRFARCLMLLVLLVDVGAVLLLFNGPLSFADAAGAAAAAGANTPVTAEVGPQPSVEALQLLGQQFAARAAELERREAELEELLRGPEVLARAGIVDQTVEHAQPAEQPALAEDPRRRNAFLSLGRAYENMEPDSAARALAQLAQRDKQAVVELLLGWKARTSGSILDALTQADPALAADLSYEIWRISGKNEPAAAEAGR